MFFSPVFDGIFDFCALYAGGSLGGASRLNHNVGEYLYRVSQNYCSTLRLKLWSGNGTIRPEIDQSGGRRLSKASGCSDHGKRKVL